MSPQVVGQHIAAGYQRHLQDPNNNTLLPPPPHPSLQPPPPQQQSPPMPTPPYDPQQVALSLEHAARNLDHAARKIAATGQLPPGALPEHQLLSLAQVPMAAGALPGGYSSGCSRDDDGGFSQQMSPGSFCDSMPSSVSSAATIATAMPPPMHAAPCWGENDRHTAQSLAQPPAPHPSALTTITTSSSASTIPDYAPRLAVSCGVGGAMSGGGMSSSSSSCYYADFHTSHHHTASPDSPLVDRPLVDEALPSMPFKRRRNGSADTLAPPNPAEE